MSKTILKTTMAYNSGQVKEEDAENEISRLEKSTGWKWRKDYADEIWETDYTEDGSPTAVRVPGHVWIVSNGISL